MKRILIISDSLGLPRVDPSIVYDFECWTHKLDSAIKNPTIVYAHKGLTTDDIVRQLAGVLQAYTPDIVIMQVGIVDAAPRILSRRQLRVLSSIPLISNLTRYLIRKLRQHILKRIKKTYVSIGQFEENLKIIASYYGFENLFLIPIFPASDAYEEHSPSIKANINAYNDVIRRYNMIDYDCHVPDIFTLKDFHHLNKDGHQLIYDAVIKKVPSLVLKEH